MKKIATYLLVINLVTFFGGLLIMRFLSNNGGRYQVLLFIIFSVSSVFGALSAIYITETKLRLAAIIVTLLAILFAFSFYYSAFITWDWNHSA